MARLDRVPAVREVAQLGAVLGREFDYEVLRELTAIEETALQERLAQLVNAELLYQRGRPPRARYFFKHALIQDAAYASLLRSTRQHYHRQIAQLIEKQFPDLVETQPELVAHHYTEAGCHEQAVDYWQRAGQRAIERSAHAEAIRHLDKGLEVLSNVPDTSERAQQELTILMALSLPLRVTQGFVPELERTFTRALALCEQIGDSPRRFQALSGLTRFHTIGGNLQMARELGQQSLLLARETQDPENLAEAHLPLGTALVPLGMFEAARAHLLQSETLYDPSRHQSLAIRLGADPRVPCWGYDSWILAILGYLGQSLQRSHDTLTLAQDQAHPFGLTLALNFAAGVHIYRREWPEVRAQAEALLALATEHGFVTFVATGNLHRGMALVEQGELEEGIRQMLQGLASLQATTIQPWAFWYAYPAEAYAKLGQPAEGLRLVDEALSIMRTTGERYWEAETYRVKGELTLQSGVVTSRESGAQKEGEECFLRALDIAREQRTKRFRTPRCHEPEPAVAEPR
jgi:tetratricopeptide (TPR) repeat protein